MKRKNFTIPLLLLTVVALLLTGCGVVFERVPGPNTGESVTGNTTTNDAETKAPDDPEPGAPATDGLEFAPLSDGNYIVTGIGTAGDRIVIPAVYQGGAVTEIGDSAFKYSDTLVSVEIPDSVHTIWPNAFTGCRALTHVSFGSGVGCIGYEAFALCDALKELSLPASLVMLDRTAFLYCSGLESISVEKGCSKYYSKGNCLIEAEGQILLLGCKNSTIPEGVAVIGSGFEYCAGLTDVVIPSSATHVSAGAFSNCVDLERITVAEGNPVYHSEGNCLIETGSKTLISGCKNSVIPCDGSVTAIGEYAFEYCTGLTDISIPDSVTSIGAGAFYNCTGLTSLSVGSGVTEIGGSMLLYTNALASITVAEANPKYHSSGNCLIETADKKLVVGCKNSVIPADGSVTTIAEGSFYGSGLENIHIPDGVTCIERSAFSCSEQLKTVTFSDNVTDIGEFAFSACTGLISVDLPGHITQIKDFVFSYCDQLTSVTIPEGVTEILWSAFERCKNLKTLTLPDSLTSIGRRAFADCSSLTELTIPDHVTVLDSMAFYQCSSLTDLTVGSGVTSVGSAVFANCTSLTDVTLPDTLKVLSYQMFYGCTALTEINIPEGVTEIESYALACTGLKSITFPASVVSIGSDTVSECPELERISVAEGNPAYISKGNCLIEIKSKHLLAGCKNSVIPADGSVEHIVFSSFYGITGLTEIVIPEGVSSTGLAVFMDCTALKRVTIPVSLKKLAESLFEDCTALTDIYYNGTRAQWGAIEKASGWDENTGSYTVHCSDGDIAGE